MAFREAKQKVLQALADGSYQHESRNDIDVKNDLLMGHVTAAELSAVIRRSNGKDHSESPHHSSPTITVHVVKREGWYIKFYFIALDAMFISVHRSQP